MQVASSHNGVLNQGTVCGDDDLSNLALCGEMKSILELFVVVRQYSPMLTAVLMPMLMHRACAVGVAGGALVVL